MEVKYTGAGPCVGENGTRALTVTVEPAFRQYTVRLAFASPAGRVYLTPPLTLTEGEAEYPLPACLLDAPGTLRAQAVAEGDGGRLAKSEIARFRVERSVAARAAREPETGGLISLETLHSALLALDGRLDGKSDTGHTHAYGDITGTPTIPTVPVISTDISADATSDLKTASPKAVKTYVDGAIPTVPVISTDISADAASDAKTASPKAVKTYVDAAVGSGVVTGDISFASGHTPTVTYKKVKQVGGVVFVNIGMVWDTALGSGSTTTLGTLTGVDAPFGVLVSDACVTAHTASGGGTAGRSVAQVTVTSGKDVILTDYDPLDDIIYLNFFYLT